MPLLFRRFAVAQRKEGAKLGNRFALSRLPDTAHRIDGVDVVSIGSPAVSDHRVAHLAVADANRVATLGEQVDHRHASQAEVLRSQRLQQTGGIAVGTQVTQRDMQANLPFAMQTGWNVSDIDIEEVEFFWKTEIFSQVTIGPVSGGRHIEQRFVLGKTNLADQVLAGHTPTLIRTGDIGFQGPKKQRIAQGRGDGWFCIDIYPQFANLADTAFLSSTAQG